MGKIIIDQQERTAREAREKIVVSSCALGEFVHISYKQLLPAVQHKSKLTAREHVELVHVLFLKSGLQSLTFLDR